MVGTLREDWRPLGEEEVLASFIVPVEDAYAYAWTLLQEGIPSLPHHLGCSEEGEHRYSLRLLPLPEGVATYGWREESQP